MKRYVFRGYSKSYASLFKKEKKRLQRILGQKAIIEHIGSTAVLGLGGKGIIDILILVPKTKIQQASKKLQKAGYLFRPSASTPERLFFRTDYEKKAVRPIHIHLTFSKKELKEKLAFRNYLLAHPEEIKKYAKIKKKAVRFAKGEGERYREYKEKFIKNIMRKAMR